MNSVLASLRRLVLDLQQTDARWALVGGLAVSAWVEPRFTRDVDVAVTVAGDEEAEQLVRGLSSLGYVLRGTVEHEYVGRLATVRFLSPADGSHSVCPYCRRAQPAGDQRRVAARQRYASVADHAVPGRLAS